MPGLLGVPPVLSSCPCTCSAPLSLKKNTPPLLFTDSLYGGRAALKPPLQHLLLYSLQRKRFAASFYSYGSTNAHSGGLLGAATACCRRRRRSPRALKQSQGFDTGSDRWGKQVCSNEGSGNLASTARSNMAAGFSRAV